MEGWAVTSALTAGARHCRRPLLGAQRVAARSACPRPAPCPAQIEYKGQSYWDCSLGADQNFNPSDPWNYVESGQVRQAPLSLWQECVAVDAPAGAAGQLASAANLAWLHSACYAHALRCEPCSTQRTRVVLVSRRLTPNPTDPASVLCPQCKPVADLNKEFDTSIDLNGAPWEAAALIGFLLLGRVAVYVALRKKTQR